VAVLFDEEMRIVGDDVDLTDSDPAAVTITMFTFNSTTTW
jgi:hypothetical protein